MLPRAQRLDTTAFAKAFGAGRAARHPLLTVRVYLRAEDPAKSQANTIRAAFVVPKKHAKAAQRNRLRRRLRECYRCHDDTARRAPALQGCDLIFMASAPAMQADWPALNEAFSQLLRRAARLAEEMKSEMRAVAQESGQTTGTAPENGNKRRNSASSAS
jgi:ribonuclease P protein component